MNFNTKTIMTAKSLLLLSLCAAIMFGRGLAQAADDSAPKLKFSAQPSDAEIFAAKALDEPLVPLPGEVRMNENQALAAALAA